MVQNHYGNGYRNGHSNGKRWLLIAALVLGGFWLASSSYHEGFTDGMIQSGQAPAAMRYRSGPHFPWEILIVGGIAYIAWRKGAFDRFGGPGGPFSGGPRELGQYGPGGGPGQTPPSGQGQGFGPAFRGPRAFFDEWHRQAHEAEQAQYPTTPTPPAPPAQPAPSAADASGNGARQTVGQYAPAPSAPSPEYWTSINRPQGTTETNSNAGTPAAPEQPTTWSV
jgi:hypothetical protein